MSKPVFLIITAQRCPIIARILIQSSEACYAFVPIPSHGITNLFSSSSYWNLL